MPWAPRSPCCPRCCRCSATASTPGGSTGRRRAAKPAPRPEDTAWWRFAHHVSGRPWPYLIAAFTLLLALATPMLWMQTSFPRRRRRRGGRRPPPRPPTPETTRTLDRVRDGPPAGVGVTGLTATTDDLSQRISDILPLFVATILIASFVLLAAVFRSIVVALKAVVMNLGVVVAVFLLSRIREHYDASGDTVESVARGIADTGRVITTTALIMTAVFLGFVADPSPMITMLGWDWPPRSCWTRRSSG